MNRIAKGALAIAVITTAQAPAKRDAADDDAGLRAPSQIEFTPAEKNRARRNAQNLASVCAAAIAAGSQKMRGVESTAQAVALLRKGVKGGPAQGFGDVIFQVPKMTDLQAQFAQRYLRWDPDGKMLMYKHE